MAYSGGIFFANIGVGGGQNFSTQKLGVAKIVVFQKGGSGGCSPGMKTGTRVHLDVPSERKTGTRVRSPKPPFTKPLLCLPSKT